MIQRFNGKLVTKEYLSSDVVLLKFELDSEFSFMEGQYAMIYIVKGDMKKWKPYSIFSPPFQKESLDLCIKIVEGGFASAVFDKVREGETFPMKGPFGRFFFDNKTANKTHYFIGVGTGLAPLNSILFENLEKYPDKKFKLLLGARLKEGVIFHEKFKKLDKDNKNFEYTPTITREKWDGLQGRVHEHLSGDLSDTTFYICGLKEMVFETKEKLESLGVKPENIKFERYS